MLVFGDSFSAKADGYVAALANQYPEKIILNASTPGIGIKQVNLFAVDRIQQTKPKAILYQVYVGNDLLDVKNLSNWRELSLARNLYWSASDFFISLRYLNQRMVVLRKDTSLIPQGLNKPFAKAMYDKRSLLFTQADATYLYKTVTITDDFLTRYALWKKEMDEFITKIPPDTKLYITFIPHCAQLNTFYYHQLLDMGNRVADSSVFFQEQYPLLQQASADFQHHPTIVFLNPLTHLKNADKEGYRLYYENDPHFNANGHQEFAHYLATNLFGVR